MWDMTCRPDLAVWMRVGTSNGRTLVLEDLGVGVRGGLQGYVEVCPGSQDGHDFLWRHICQGSESLNIG